MQKIFQARTATQICVVALFTAMNIALSSFGVPVPGGKFYLNDIVIVAAALTLDPFGAAVAGGVGAFLGDLLFYPTPMFVTLAVRVIQSLAIYFLSRKMLKDKPMIATIIAVCIGAVIMIVGYSLGRAFVYSTPEYALLKLPYQILQAVIGAVVGIIIFRKAKLKNLYDKALKKE